MIATKTSSIIETRNLTKSYGETMAVEKLDLLVSKNSIFALLGPNGSGKSTTIRLLLGLIRPSTGGELYLGYDLLSDSIEIRRRIGYLAQDYRFYKRMTVLETLQYVVGFFNVDQKDSLRKGCRKAWISWALLLSAITSLAPFPVERGRDWE